MSFRRFIQRVFENGQGTFKSEFAKQLNFQKVQKKENKPEYAPTKSVHHVTSQKCDILTEDSARSDLKRLKLENEELKLKIQRCQVEEERYRHLQNEVEQLTRKIYEVIKHDLSRGKEQDKCFLIQTLIFMKHL